MVLKESFQKGRLYWREKRQLRKRLRQMLLLVGLVWYFNCLPDTLFSDSTSTVLLDRNGQLLGAKIADDGQWRFPESEVVPPKMAACLIEFEDRNFYTHIGISAKGIGRAFAQNLKKGRVVSGGSTITMQLARIMRKNPPRTYSEKLLEMVLATRIEIRYSKQEILGLYASHAPFGNNVVGLDAASWRYFGRSAQQLSWGESATLAVLPNAPGLIYPGRNHTLLREKRDRLLKRLYENKVIDATEFELAVSEPLPEKPLPLPQLAPHLLDRLMQQGYRGKSITSTLDLPLQEKAVQQLRMYSAVLQENQVMNGALLITSVKTGKILAYVGNVPLDEAANGKDVDCIQAPRSTGSILKPLLYAKSMENGTIAPQQLLTDIPSQFGSFAPKNYSGQFDGALPAHKALSRSLNIPLVHLLNSYGVTKFHGDLKTYGLTTLHQPARHYGLSLILGGAEATLFDLNRTYTQMAQELAFGAAKPVKLIEDQAQETVKPVRSQPKTDRGCIYSTFEALVEVNRPDEDNNWREFASAQKIAWKTGTSFGFRDAWAIGITPEYVVSVWIGNADGEGRPGLTGIQAAAPLLFDLFRQLPASDQWFKAPTGSMAYARICRESGHRASDLCPVADYHQIPKTCLETMACPYHQTVHLDKTRQFRVDSECADVFAMTHETFFVLPSVIERYYRFNHPNYRSLPEFLPGCTGRAADKAMSLVYPRNGSRIYVPIEIDGKPGRTIFEAVHRNSHTKIYWHLDDRYIGETMEIHQLALNPPIGTHKLTLVDAQGTSTSVSFEILGKNTKGL